MYMEMYTTSLQVWGHCHCYKEHALVLPRDLLNFNGTKRIRGLHMRLHDGIVEPITTCG
jgi:hypothetical protein